MVVIDLSFTTKEDTQAVIEISSSLSDISLPETREIDEFVSSNHESLESNQNDFVPEITIPEPQAVVARIYTTQELNEILVESEEDVENLPDNGLPTINEDGTEKNKKGNRTTNRSTNNILTALRRSIQAEPGKPQPYHGSSSSFGIEQRLLAAGAKTGDVQVSLAWNTVDDIDLHVSFTPGNGLIDTINWTRRRGQFTGGMLDIDMNASAGLLQNQAVENIFWPPGSSPRGYFIVYVHFFRTWSGDHQTPVLVRIKNGETVTEHKVMAVYGGLPQEVARFNFGAKNYKF